MKELKSVWYWFSFTELKDLKTSTSDPSPQQYKRNRFKILDQQQDQSAAQRS